EAAGLRTGSSGLVPQQRWQPFEARWQSEAAGKLQAQRIILTFAGGANFGWDLATFPQGWTTIGTVNEAIEARRGCKVGGVPVSLGPLELEVAPSHQQPHLQVSLAKVGLVGEHVQAMCSITTVDAVHRVRLSLQAAYQEGTRDPGLSASPPDPDERLKEDKDPAAASGVVDDPAGAVDLEPGRAHVFCAWVHADRAGSIRVSCRLQYRAAGLPGDTSCHLEAAVQLPVVQPFSLVEAAEWVEAQPLAGHISLAELDPLASQDCHTALLQLLHTGEAEAIGLGTLEVSWSRSRPPLQQTSTAGDAAPQRNTEGPVSASSWDSTQQKVTSRIPLASASFRQSVLRAHMALPASMTAGVAFVYAVRLKNRTPLPQRVGIAMSPDTRSFLVAGSKVSMATVLPWQEQTLSWHLTPFASGSLPLPELKLTADRYKASLNVMAGRHIIVQPAAS
ncbi:hypothetical protein WJX84_006046, partial [Apatococcus fuscideae]